MKTKKPTLPPKDFDDFLSRFSPEARKAILALINDDLIANGYLDKPEEEDGETE